MDVKTNQEMHECDNCGNQIPTTLKYCSEACLFQRQFKQATENIIEFSTFLNSLQLFRCLKCNKAIGYKLHMDFDSYAYCSKDCQYDTDKK